MTAPPSLTGYWRPSFRPRSSISVADETSAPALPRLAEPLSLRRRRPGRGGGWRQVEDGDLSGRATAARYPVPPRSSAPVRARWPMAACTFAGTPAHGAMRRSISTLVPAQGGEVGREDPACVRLADDPCSFSIEHRLVDESEVEPNSSGVGAIKRLRRRRPRWPLGQLVRPSPSAVKISRFSPLQGARGGHRRARRWRAFLALILLKPGARVRARQGGTAITTYFMREIAAVRQFPVACPAGEVVKASVARC